MKRVINNSFKKIAVVLFCLVIITPVCFSQEKEKEDISCKEVYELIQKNRTNTNFVIIDFRPEEKYEKIHLENAIYYDVFLDDIDEWLKKLDKSKTYLIYCSVGYRSGIALKKMKALNFKNVYHLYEGIFEYQKQGYKVITSG